MISKWWQKEFDWHCPSVKVPMANAGQRNFEIWFYEQILRRQSDYWEVLAVLGNHYTATKRYKDGLDVDMKLAALRPKDGVVYYNLACSYSLTGHVDAALAALERSMALGYRDFQHIIRDHDLEAVRKDKRFRSLLSKFVKV